MINSVKRYIPENFKPYVSSNDFRQRKRRLIKEKEKQFKTVFLNSYEEAFDYFNIKSKSCLSFHHHLRNGDHVINDVCKVVKDRDLKDMVFAPSSIFPSYIGLVDLIKNQNIVSIHTNYINGPVAKIISKGYLKGDLIMNTHGGRARSIESGDLSIDVAFLACPVVDKAGNGHGSFGKSACGTLGYGESDLHYAKKVILVTDTIIEKLDVHQFDAMFVDAVILVDSIGDSKGIVSGTTKLTKDPIGLKIAKECANLLDYLGVIKQGFSMQTGAGKTSLSVVKYIRDIMIKKNIKGSFASGGITKSYVQMLEEGLFDELFDVQCFDLDAVKSFNSNINHKKMSASKYGNPFEKDIIANKLSFVVLGAAEIDLDYNVNVTTDSLGNLIGGSGGHADVAYGADITIIISPLIKSRIPLIKENVMTITTPGCDVDILVTERGIAVNPLRYDIIEKLKNSHFPIMTIKELFLKTLNITGIPKKIEHEDEIVGYVEYRDGTYLDCIYKSKY